MCAIDSLRLKSPQLNEPLGQFRRASLSTVVTPMRKVIDACVEPLSSALAEFEVGGQEV